LGAPVNGKVDAIAAVRRQRPPMRQTEGAKLARKAEKTATWKG